MARKNGISKALGLIGVLTLASPAFATDEPGKSADESCSCSEERCEHERQAGVVEDRSEEHFYNIGVVTPENMEQVWSSKGDRAVPVKTEKQRRYE